MDEKERIQVRLNEIRDTIFELEQRSRMSWWNGGIPRREAHDKILSLEMEEEKLRSRLSKLESIALAQETEQQVRKAIDEKIPGIAAAVDSSEAKEVAAEDGKSVIQPKKGAHYPPDQLADLFVDFVEEAGNESPSQQELEKRTGASQSTWSRVFQKKEFWITVQGKLIKRVDEVNRRVGETEEKKNQMIQAVRIAEDKIEAFKQKYTSGKEIVSDMVKLEDNDASEVGEEHDDVATAKMSKDDLIKEIISLHSDWKKEDLETRNEEELREIFKGLD